MEHLYLGIRRIAFSGRGHRRFIGLGAGGRRYMIGIAVVRMDRRDEKTFAFGPDWQTAGFFGFRLALGKLIGLRRAPKLMEVGHRHAPMCHGTSRVRRRYIAESLFRSGIGKRV